MNDAPSSPPAPVAMEEEDVVASSLTTVSAVAATANSSTSLNRTPAAFSLSGSEGEDDEEPTFEDMPDSNAPTPRPTFRKYQKRSLGNNATDQDKNPKKRKYTTKKKNTSTGNDHNASETKPKVGRPRKIKPSDEDNDASAASSSVDESSLTPVVRAAVQKMKDQLRDEFERERDHYLSLIPEYIKSLFGRIAFTGYCGQWYPVLIINPFHVPFHVRGQWTDMINRLQAKDRVSKMSVLVYYLGAESPKDYYSFNPQNSIVPLIEEDESGQWKVVGDNSSYKEFPHVTNPTLKKIFSKHFARWANAIALSTSATSHDSKEANTVKELVEFLAIEPDKRRKECLPEAWEDFNSRDLLSEHVDSIEVMEQIESKSGSQQGPVSLSSLKAKATPKAKTIKKLTKPKSIKTIDSEMTVTHSEAHDVPSLTKSIEFSDHSPNETVGTKLISKKTKAKKLARQEIMREDIPQDSMAKKLKATIEEDDDVEIDPDLDQIPSDDEKDDDFTDDDPSRTQLAKKSVGERTSHFKKSSSSQPKKVKVIKQERVAKPKPRNTSDVEQTLYLECHSSFGEMVKAWKKALRDEHSARLTELVNEFMPVVPRLTSYYIEYSKLTKNWSEVKRLVPMDLQTAFKQALRDQYEKDKLLAFPGFVPAEKEGGGKPKHEASTNQSSNVTARKNSSIVKSSSVDDKALQVPNVKTEYSKHNSTTVTSGVVASQSLDRAKQTKSATLERNNPTPLPSSSNTGSTRLQIQRTNFTLSNFTSRQSHAVTTTNVNTAPGSSPAPKQLPLWITGPPSCSPPTDDNRCVALEFLRETGSNFPPGKVDAESFAFAVEAAIHAYAINEYNVGDKQFMNRYWKKLHSLNAAIMGKHAPGTLMDQILNGHFLHPTALVDLGEQELCDAFLGKTTSPPLPRFHR